MKFTNLFLGTYVLFLSACATTYTMDKLTEEEKTYIAKVNAATTVFEVEKSKAEEVWSRGHSFINRFAGMKIQTSNDYFLATYNPNVSQNGTIGYTLMKELVGDKVKFTVECQNSLSNFKYTAAVCRSNEKIMAHYMQTGELNQNFVNSIISDPTTSK